LSSSTVPLLPGLCAHSSGALWIAESQTAIVADLHLGYSWAQRRRGELGPLADFRTREKLFRLADDLNPLRIVFLGDLVHAPRPCAPEREWIEDTLVQLKARAELIAVRGNHDRAFSREFGHLDIETVESWSADNLIAVHGDRFHFAAPADGVLIIGHFHPCLGVKDAAGASQKLALYLVSAGCVLLPAFSPFARGYDVISGLPQELAACFRNQEISAYAISSTRVVHLGPLRRAIELNFEADVSAPERFRRRRVVSTAKS
jgi:putative SbcD/Mre11-related phosphoesterase